MGARDCRLIPLTCWEKQHQKPCQPGITLHPGKIFKVFSDKGSESSLSADFKKNSREYSLCKRNIKVVRKEQRARTMINMINLGKYWPYKTMLIMSAGFQIYTKLKYMTA